jgi:hypothetical protein
MPLNMAVVRASLPYVPRTFRLSPMIAGGVLASVVAARVSLESEMTSSVISACVAVPLAFSFDDAGSSVVGASPTPRAARWAMRLMITVSVALVWWGVAAVVAAGRHQGFTWLGGRGGWLEAAVLSIVAIAAGAAMADRLERGFRASDGGGVAAAVVAIGVVCSLVNSIRVFRLHPVDEVRGRWLVIGLSAAAALWWCAREPFTRGARGLLRRGGSRSPSPWRQ